MWIRPHPKSLSTGEGGGEAKDMAYPARLVLLHS